LQNQHRDWYSRNAKWVFLGVLDIFVLLLVASWRDASLGIVLATCFLVAVWALTSWIIPAIKDLYSDE
jgi:hypothetical protein